MKYIQIKRNILASTFALSTLSVAMFSHAQSSSLLVPMCATTALNMAAVSSLDIEKIQVTGEINSLILSSNIDLASSSSPDLRKQIDLLPSLDINSNGRVTGVLQYRGLFSDRVNVRVDSASIAGAGPNAMDSPLSHVIGTAGQTIKIYNGIAPVSADAETLGGAIDIVDTAPLYTNSANYEHSGLASFGLFSNDGELLSAQFQSVNKSSYFAINADTQEGNNYKTGDNRIVPSTFYDRYGVKLRAGLKIDKHEFDWSISARNTDESGTPSLAMDIIYIDSLVASMKYRYQIDTEWALKSHIYGNNNEHGMNNFSFRPNNNLIRHRLNTVDSQGRGLDLVLSHSGDVWESEYGVNTKLTTHNSFITNPNNAAFFINNFDEVERDLFSVYAQTGQKSLADNEQQFDAWQVGARYSRVNASANPIGSNMAMMNPNIRNLRDAFNAADRALDFSLLDLVAKSSFVVNSSMKLQFSAGIKEKAPSYQQLYTWFPLGISAGLADGRNYIGNLDLGKETAIKFDLSALIEGENWRLIPNMFVSNINDYIIGMPSENSSANAIAMMNSIPAPLQWENQDARIVGFDISYQYRFNDALNLNFVSQFLRGKQLGELEQNLYRLSPVSANVTLDWNKDNYQVMLIANLVGAQNKVAQIQNETPTSGYGTLDIQASYEFENGLKLSILVENMLNKAYASHLGGINRVGQTDIAIGEKLPSAGRNLGAFVQYMF